MIEPQVAEHMVITVNCIRVIGVEAIWVIYVVMSVILATSCDIVVDIRCVGGEVSIVLLLTIRLLAVLLLQ